MNSESSDFVTSVETFKRAYNNYIDEVSVPLSGGAATKCSADQYCYEMSYDKLKEQYAALESQLDTVSVVSIGSILSSPMVVLFKQYVGSAKGACKNSLVAAMRPEYDEIQNLKF